LVETTKNKKVAGLRICALIRDFNRYDTGRAGYPQSPIHVVEIPMWDSFKAETYIRERLNTHRDSKVSADLGGNLPQCSPEEQWMSESTFAVRREGRKTAIRVFKSIEEAKELAAKEKGYVETRIGEPKRCTGNYCGVAEHCDQYKLFQAGFSDPV